jgi:hypothetical protein
MSDRGENRKKRQAPGISRLEWFEITDLPVKHTPTWTSEHSASSLMPIACKTADLPVPAGDTTRGDFPMV